MKNITVSLDDETYRRARLWAAERDISVSAMVKCILTTLPIRSQSKPRNTDRPPTPPDKPSGGAGTSIPGIQAVNEDETVGIPTWGDMIRHFTQKCLK